MPKLAHIHSIYTLTKFALLVIFLAISAVIINTLRFNPPLDHNPILSELKPSFSAISDTQKQHIVRRLAQSIRFQTISNEDPKRINASEFSSFNQFLKSEYSVVFNKLHVQTFNQHALLFKWPGSNPALKPALFLAHTDVVPVQTNESSKWIHPPFAGTVQDGFIWGRGALDNKVGVLGQLEAIQKLIQDANFQPERTLYFAFGHDEEIGGKLGAMAIANHFRKQNIRFEFLVDEGMMITKNLVPNIPHRVALIGPGEKGYLSLKLSVDSQGGHLSKPPMLTASGRIARAVDKIQSEPFKINLKYSAEFIRHLGDDAPMLQRMVMANPWLFQPVASSLVPQVPELLATLRTTTAPTILKGSTKDNVLATEASAVINFRILPSDTIEFVIKETVRKIDDPLVSVEIYGTPSEPSRISSTQASGFQIIRQSVLEVINEEPITVAPMLVIAATDARHYQDLTEQSYRFSPYTITPETKDGFHGINERISVESYIEAVHIYQQLIINSSLPF